MSNTNTTSFTNGLLPGGRRPRLYLAKGAQAIKFEGDNIPGWCVIAHSRYEKNGKWSCTDYTLTLSPGVRALHFVSPLHGVWGAGFTSWGELAASLGIPVEVAQEVVRKEYTTTAQRLDQIEAFSLEVEASGQTAETVVIVVSRPHDTTSATGRTCDGRIVTIAPNPDWYTPTVVSPEGCKIVSSGHKPGMKGGYYNVEVVVPTTGG